MKIVFPRIIVGNRGDLASRWALLRALQELDVAKSSTVFVHFSEEVPDEIGKKLPYQPLKNIFPALSGMKAFLKADTVAWAVGLDFQDDASLLKLLYLKVQFSFYRFLGLRVWCLFQGAGPIVTSFGRNIARSGLKEVDIFLARDPATLKLLKDINDQPRYLLGHDAIFLPGLEDEYSHVPENDKIWIDDLTRGAQSPVVGFNIRLWFHFSSSILPFQFAKKHYLERANEKMEKLVHSAVENIRYLRTVFQARVLLLSAYQPSSVSWEDDIQWLQAIKNHFADDPDVILVDRYMSMPSYFQLMAQLDFAIGMRLHTTLIALRMGVPSINLSYTLKGKNILEHLGLPDYAVNLENFIATPDILYPKVASILNNLPGERVRVEKAVQSAVKENDTLLKELFKK